MDVSLASWLLVVVALVAANLPFFNERCFAILAWRRFSPKPFWLRLFEMITLYFAVGAVAMTLEAQSGNSFKQTWEFYAISVCLFIVLAFPGFVFRYLKKRHG